MTVVERGSMRAAAAEDYVVRRMTDRDAIRTLLETRRAYSAYALGQLDPGLFRLSQWWSAEGRSGQAVVLHSRGGLGNATFMLGESGALGALLRVHPGPRHAFLTCEVHHLDAVQANYHLEHRQTMIRMQVTAETFRPCALPDVVRMTGAYTRQINALYRLEGVPSFYTPHQIDDSVYYGAQRDGHLVAIAGTHVISYGSGIAVVGNVYTHPTYRGRHLAQATTSAVTEKLLGVCREVVLSVDPANAAAVRAYERLGYREVARLVEGPAVRRDVLGAVTAARRYIARMRGRDEGIEIVRHAPAGNTSTGGID